MFAVNVGCCDQVIMFLTLVRNIPGLNFIMDSCICWKAIQPRAQLHYLIGHLYRSTKPLPFVRW